VRAVFSYVILDFFYVNSHFSYVKADFSYVTSRFPQKSPLPKNVHIKTPSSFLVKVGVFIFYRIPWVSSNG